MDSNKDLIEYKICHMLEKILIDDEETETACGTDVNSLYPVNDFIRKEKKSITNIDRQKINLHDNLNKYERLYEQQKINIFKHKKFNTTNQTESPLKKNLNTNSDIYNKINGSQLFSLNNLEVLENFVNEKLEAISEDLYLTIKGNITSLLKNQNTSRVLQRCLNKTDKSVIKNIFYEIIPQLYEIIIDPYGNYFCQKFYSYISYEDRLTFIIQITKNFAFIANNPIGTYPLQTIIEKLNSKEEVYIISETLRNSKLLEEICNDSHGVHVVEKILICFSEEYIYFVYEYILSNFLEFSNNSSGLVLIKKTIIHAKHQLLIKRIQYLIVNNFNVLIQNAYGNYSIQAAFDVLDY
jgi:hypothetical protein